MSYIYFYIAKIKSISSALAIGKKEAEWELKSNDKSFQFDIEETETLYIGRLEKSHEVYEKKLEFHLKRYQTKLNKSIYKIDLFDALGRIAFECETIFVGAAITKDMILEAVKKETERRIKIKQQIELKGAEMKKVYRKYEKIEETWVDYWKNASTRLEAFYKKHPMPLKINYQRSGISSLLFGAFDKDRYERDSSDHYRKWDWTCNKIAVDSQALKNVFICKCPGLCGEYIKFDINYGSQQYGDMYYFEDDYPFNVYKPLNSITGYCSECGTFAITCDDEHTCIFSSQIPEIVFYVMKYIIKNNISYNIEKKLYGIQR